MLGKVVPEALGANLTYIVRARFVLLRDLGSSLSPTNSFNIIQGLETLPLRFKKHQENALSVAKFLKNHKSINKVIYPGFHDGENKKRADKYLDDGFGPLVGFELKDKKGSIIKKTKKSTKKSVSKKKSWKIYDL